jgi:hypothetical protein
MGARRRVWRVVGIGVGLLSHDGEVEGVVVKNDAVLELCVRGSACYAQAHIPKRRSHHGVPGVSLGFLQVSSTTPVGYL